MSNLMSKQNPSLGGRLWGVFKGEKVGFRPAMEVVAESNPKSPFPLKYGLQKVKSCENYMGLAQNQGVAAPY